ncbi:MAG: lasso peptide biosynthesis B2 protein [Sphingomicrobium sp.]
MPARPKSPATSTSCWTSWRKADSLPLVERWRSKARTATAMVMLCYARLLVAWVSLARWRDSLGWHSLAAGNPPDALTISRKLADHVEWAAVRLPLQTKCLPRAIALSWMLRREQIGHAVVIAVRPADLRGSADALHAWVEVDSQKILGDLPGPWIETLRLGD